MVTFGLFSIEYVPEIDYFLMKNFVNNKISID